ncbi:hypothetical protein [Rhizobium mongolense]|uniref:hypothetical protein n=1 Tax=Rhizobium mongolense TaxID=57676 RepID=UPI0034A412BA
MKVNAILAASVATSIAMFSQATQASTQTYADQTTWSSAVTVTGGDNYNGYSWSTEYEQYFGTSGANLSGVGYLGDAELFGIGTKTSHDASYLRSSGFVLWQNGLTHTLTLAFGSFVTPSVLTSANFTAHRHRLPLPSAMASAP